jgi:hypothetical protein
MKYWNEENSDGTILWKSTIMIERLKMIFMMINTRQLWWIRDKYLIVRIIKDFKSLLNGELGYISRLLSDFSWEKFRQIYMH